MHPTSVSLASADRIVKTAGILTLVVGGLVLVGGWILRIPTFQSVLPGLPKMVGNTSIGFILAGTSLLLLGTYADRPRARFVGKLCALLALLLGALTLSEYLFGWNLGIDQFFIQDAAAALRTSIPGRPSPQTSLDFVLVGLALLLPKVKIRHRYHLTQSCALMAGLIALLALLGYLYGVAPLYSSSPYTGMAIPTAVVFLLLGVGILCTQPDSGLIGILYSDSAGGLMARRLLPAAVIIPSVIGWITLKGFQSDLYELNFGISLFVLSNIVVFAGIIWQTSLVIHQLDRERQGIGQEITQLNTALNQRALDLEAANRDLEAFSYTVSHDLRAPLRSVNGFTTILLRKYADSIDAEGQTLIQRVIAASQRMGELIDDLLELSQMTRTILTYTDVNLSAITGEIATAIQATEPDRKASFVITDGLITRGDAGMLRIVLENLLNNAWKFTRKQPETRIELCCIERDGQPVYCVRDNGVGFAMADGSKIFDAFQRLHTRSEFEGSGIGLSIVQRIIVRHGGKIWAEAAVNAGAAFYFTTSAAAPSLTEKKSPLVLRSD